MAFEWRVLFREVTVSFFLSFFLVGVRTVLWVVRAPFLFVVCFSFSCASSFLFSFLPAFCVACFRFLCGRARCCLFVLFRSCYYCFVALLFSA